MIRMMLETVDVLDETLLHVNWSLLGEEDEEFAMICSLNWVTGFRLRFILQPFESIVEA